MPVPELPGPGAYETLAWGPAGALQIPKLPLAQVNTPAFLYMYICIYIHIYMYVGVGQTKNRYPFLGNSPFCLVHFADSEAEVIYLCILGRPAVPFSSFFGGWFPY